VALGHGAIVPPRGLTLIERLPYIASGIEDVVQRTRPDCAAVEDIFLFKNTRVALQLGQARGAALVPLLSAGLPVSEYAPRLVKKAITGHGGADKDQVQRMVALLLGMRDRPMLPDAADALAVAICHAHACAQQRFRQAAGA
jgi:crossover junction endodeoxyribonuclease RuvC